jgi:hypothetical protein
MPYGLMRASCWTTRILESRFRIAIGPSVIRLCAVQCTQRCCNGLSPHAVSNGLNEMEISVALRKH